jgi:hypothetical protein
MKQTAWLLVRGADFGESGCDVRKLIVRFRRSQISLSAISMGNFGPSTDKSTPLRNNNLGEQHKE